MVYRGSYKSTRARAATLVNPEKPVCVGRGSGAGRPWQKGISDFPLKVACLNRFTQKVFCRGKLIAHFICEKTLFSFF